MNRKQGVNVQETGGVKHLDDLGDDGELLGRDLDPDIECLDQLCPHLLAGVRADIRVWLQ